MARETNKLTNPAVKALKPRDKPYTVSDGQGLLLKVMPNGSKLWRLRYRVGDKQMELPFGSYDDGVTIAEARERARAARLQLRDGVDPAAARKEAKQTREREAGSTFDAVAEAHIAAQSWTPGTAAKQRARVREYLSQAFGSRPVASISRAEVIARLQAVAKLGKLDTLHRVKALAQAIFGHAVDSGLCEVNPASELGRVLPARPESQKTAAILNPARLGQVLRMLDGYGKTGTPQVAFALRLLPHLFVRPGNLQKARWQDIRWEDGYWEIPAEDMKRRKNGALLVPLSTQVVGMLRELQQHTGSGVYLFPSERGQGRHISENTLNVALRSIGLSPDEVTAHGFRSTARTLMAERGVSPEVIETQLHHKLGTTVQQAYNRAQYLPQRRVMMQEWSDYLDSLKAGGNGPTPPTVAGNTAV